MLVRLRTSLAAAIEPWRRRRGAPAHDPFAALAVQTRLGILAAQVQALEDDPRAFARARRLIATQAAYDAVLVEACHLAGVPDPDPADYYAPAARPVEAPRETPDQLLLSAPLRFRDELELASRGWTW